MYIDVLFLLNFGVDFLLLMAANKLCGYPFHVKRFACAGLLGGVYGGLCIVPGFYLLSGFLGRILCLLLISGIAFGFSKSSIRPSILFVFLTMALGGMAYGFGSRHFFAIIFSAISVAILCFIGFRGRTGTEYIPVCIHGEERGLQFLALRDTGNTLTDPISGQQVLVASSTLGRQLLGVTQEDLKDPVSAIEKVPGGRLIPYQSVGTEGGLLLARRFEDVTIGNCRGSCVVAFVPHELGKGEPYDALTGGVA